MSYIFPSLLKMGDSDDFSDPIENKQHFRLHVLNRQKLNHNVNENLSEWKNKNKDI